MKLLLSFVTLVCLAGCSFRGTYYLRNLSDEPAVVTAVLEEGNTSDQWATATLKYDDRIKDVRFGMAKSFNKNIPVTVVDLSRVAFVVPPKSTVYVGLQLQDRFLGGFQQARISVGDVEQSFTFDDPDQMIFHAQSPTKFTARYDIKQ